MTLYFYFYCMTIYFSPFQTRHTLYLIIAEIGREIQLHVSYLAEVYELQQRIFAYVKQFPTISRISQDTQAGTFRENHIQGFHLEHATAIKSDNGIPSSEQIVMV